MASRCAVRVAASARARAAAAAAHPSRHLTRARTDRSAGTRSTRRPRLPVECRHRTNRLGRNGGQRSAERRQLARALDVLDGVCLGQRRRHPRSRPPPKSMSTWAPLLGGLSKSSVAAAAVDEALDIGAIRGTAGLRVRGRSPA